TKAERHKIHRTRASLLTSGLMWIFGADADIREEMSNTQCFHMQFEKPDYICDKSNAM
ncbi:Hypothetical protein SMAX5B_017095, partial [Scophthalmus maximus]